jgi:hypothetical protein
LGLDDQEEALSRYCLITATYTIEQYCKRHFFRKKHTDYLTFTGEHISNLREHLVRWILAVWVAKAGMVQQRKTLFGRKTLLIPNITIASLTKEFMRIYLSPPFCSPRSGFHRKKTRIRVWYLAGYVPGNVPADLALACLELAPGTWPAT